MEEALAAEVRPWPCLCRSLGPAPSSFWVGRVSSREKEVLIFIVLSTYVFRRCEILCTFWFFGVRFFFGGSPGGEDGLLASTSLS